MRLSRLPSLGSLALLAIVIVVLLAGGDDDAGEGGRNDGGGGGGSVRARVIDVVDGDTIEVDLAGEVEDVRYIGVDTPESVAPGQPVECFGPQASDFNRRLVEDKTVRLVFDAERRDHYGRLLAYIYAGERFVNAELVREGFATTLTIAPNDRFAALFDRLEQDRDRPRVLPRLRDGGPRSARPRARRRLPILQPPRSRARPRWLLRALLAELPGARAVRLRAPDRGRR